MAAFAGGDDIGAVVAEIGHYSTKIGWAGDDAPRSYFPSVRLCVVFVCVSVFVFIPCSFSLLLACFSFFCLQRCTDYYLQNVAVLRKDDKSRRIQGVQYDYYTHPIQRKTFDDGNWETCNPIDPTSGLMYDPSSTQGSDSFDLLRDFLHHGYSTALQQAKIEEHPFLMMERPYNTPAIRQQTLECLMEEMNVPAAFIAKDAVLMCYGCGRTTATVVDIGHSGTTVTPVFDGFAETKGIRRSPTGVHAMDKLILERLDALNKSKQPAAHDGIRPLYQVRPVRPIFDPEGQTLPRPQRHPSIHFHARMEVARECREFGAGAAVNISDTAFHAPGKPFTLPDGTILDVPSVDRFAAADLVLGSSPATVELREKHFEECRSYLKKIIEKSQFEEDDEEEEKSEKDDKFSEEAAVGLSKRRSKQSQKPQTTKLFSNRLLNRACTKHLQTLLDDQLSASPLASMVCDAAYRCDREQQAALLGNVVLGGGGSCLGPTEQAVPDYLRDQIESLIHAHTPGWRVRLLTPSVSERSILSWLGGSILGSLGSFHEMWISKQEYEEWGSAIVNRKCP